jgi:hypothetical protein
MILKSVNLTYFNDLKIKNDFYKRIFEHKKKQLIYANKQIK